MSEGVKPVGVFLPAGVIPLLEGDKHTRPIVCRSRTWKAIEPKISPLGTSQVWESPPRRMIDRLISLSFGTVPWVGITVHAHRWASRRLNNPPGSGKLGALLVVSGLIVRLLTFLDWFQRSSWGLLPVCVRPLATPVSPGVFVSATVFDGSAARESWKNPSFLKERGFSAGLRGRVSYCS